MGSQKEVSFFEKAFENMDAESRESFYETVFLHDDSDYAARVRLEYYAGKLKHMGENVQIGAGVKIVNPQYISLGDNVMIGDGATLIAHGPGGITLEDRVWLNDRVYLDTESVEEGYINALAKQHFKLGVAEYINAMRINHACVLIEENYTGVSDIAFLCGFKDAMYFSKVFKRVTGQSPKEFIHQKNHH